MGNIKADFNQKEVSIEEEKSELKVNNRENSAYMRYHTSEIAQSEKILKTAIKITWVGFVVLVLGCIMGFTGKTGEAVVTSISAVVLEGIAGTIYVLVDKSSKSKYQYFKKLSEDENDRKIIYMVEHCEDKQFQKEMLRILVNNWCERMKIKTRSENID